mmetsp:Transcript_12095/g.24334  ORF Transcript_12095/g.24334 Transcript_12095/m.24334 type:complete len:741 (+) Transcript_12095:277-2499(+)
MSSERHPESRLDAATTKLYVELFLSPTNRIFTDRLREFVSTLPQDVSEPYLSRPQAFSRQDLERWGRQSGYLASSDSEDSSPGVAGVGGPQAGSGGASVESKGPGPARGSLLGSGQQSSVVGGNISAVTAAVSNPALSSGIEGPRGDLLGSPRGRRASGGVPRAGGTPGIPGGSFPGELQRLDGSPTPFSTVDELSKHALDRKLVSSRSAQSLRTSGLNIGDLAAMSRGDWAELLPSFSCRNRLQRHLKVLGMKLSVHGQDASVHRPSAVPPSRAELRRSLREALVAKDWDLATAIRAQLVDADGAGARSRASRCAKEWSEELKKAQEALDVEACRRLDGAMRVAQVAARGEASDEDVRLFLEVEEKVRADSMGPRLDDAGRQQDLFRRAREAAGIVNNVAPLASRDSTAHLRRSSPKTFSMLPSPEGSTVSSGAESHGCEAAMDWLDAAQAKYREGNAALSGAELDNLNPPHREVLDLLLTGKEMIRRVRPSLQQDAHGPVKMGFLALVVAHCAIHGARHFDHFFDRARHGHLVSPSVMNAVDQFARDYQKYLDLRTRITMEQKLAKDGWVRKVFPTWTSDSLQSGALAKAAESSAVTGGDKSKALASAAVVAQWKPSASWTPESHPLDKASPTIDKMRIMKGYYEAIGAANGSPACESCGLPHDMTKSTCHWHKFPHYRSKAFRKGHALALKNGYFNETEVDEWNGRSGREVTHRCDPSGRHPQKPTLVDLRGGGSTP